MAVREFLQMLPTQSPVTWALKMDPPALRDRGCKDKVV